MHAWVRPVHACTGGLLKGNSDMSGPYVYGEVRLSASDLAFFAVRPVRVRGGCIACASHKSLRGPVRACTGRSARAVDADANAESGPCAYGEVDTVYFD